MNELDIKLEKTEYLAGQEAKGLITFSVDNDMEFTNFKFQVLGKEDPLKGVFDFHEDSRVDWGGGGDSFRYRPATEKVSNIFFLEDLSNSLSGSPGIKTSIDGTLQLKKGRWTVPFHFSIPDNSMESYDGKNVCISYEVVVTASGIFKFDHHNNQPFTVLNPNYKQKVEGKTLSLFDKPIIQDWKEQEEIKHGLKVSLTLDDNRYGFSPGEIVRGRITATSVNGDDKKIPKIKKAEITLSQIEDSTKITNPIAKNEIFKQQISQDQLKENSSRNNVVFGIPLNDGIRKKRNYAGKLTAYYWLLEAKLDMGLTRHFYRSTIIEVT